MFAATALLRTPYSLGVTHVGNAVLFSRIPCLEPASTAACATLSGFPLHAFSSREIGHGIHDLLTLIWREPLSGLGMIRDSLGAVHPASRTNEHVHLVLRHAEAAARFR